MLWKDLAYFISLKTSNLSDYTWPNSSSTLFVANLVRVVVSAVN